MSIIQSTNQISIIMLPYAVPSCFASKFSRDRSMHLTILYGKGGSQIPNDIVYIMEPVHSPSSGI